MTEDDNRIDSYQSYPCFCLMSNYGSYVKAIQKASTHLTEETFFCGDIAVLTPLPMGKGKGEG